jgi:hypothetical protein
MADDELTTLDASQLAAVTGGRLTRGPAQVDPALVQGLVELTKAVASVGQGLTAQREASSQQMMQMLAQMMQRK